MTFLVVIKVMKKDKIKVLDEVLNEDRIKQFLVLDAPAGENPDFHRLQKAYRGMPAVYFEEFIELFVEAGGNINAQSARGETLLQQIQTHKKSAEYQEILIAAGAQ